MRVVLAISALLLSIGAVTPPPGGTLRGPPISRHAEMSDPGNSHPCRDRIERVRQKRGLPRLDRDNASPDEPLLIAAVDKRIDGCSVLVMRGNLNDIRPLPAPADGARMRPAQ